MPQGLGEMESALTRGDPALGNRSRKSAEAIVVVDTSCEQKPQMAHKNNEGLNVKRFQMRSWSVPKGAARHK